MSVYERPHGHQDFANAREFEQAVADALEPHTHQIITEFTKADRLDIWVPGFMLDVKEKHQPLTGRWTQHVDDWEERDVFVMDELSVRRALQKSVTSTYFLIRDNPSGGRMFICSALEVACTERIRLDRKSSAGNLKGKWLINLQSFRRLPTIDSVFAFITDDLAKEPWKESGCLSQVVEVPLV